MGAENLQDLRFWNQLPLLVGTEHCDRPAIHGDGKLLPTLRLPQDLAAVVPELTLGNGFHRERVA